MERERIKSYFENLVKRNPTVYRFDDDKERRGVPKEMLDGKDCWKFVEIHFQDEEIECMEKEFNIKLPNIYKEFISTYCHVLGKLAGIIDNYFGEKNRVVYIVIPSQISNDPLGEIRNVLEQFEEMVSEGYVPFAELNGIGPLCIDTKANNKIVWFDHELYYRCLSRQEYEEIAVDFFDDFYQFLDCFFAGQKHKIL